MHCKSLNFTSVYVNLFSGIRYIYITLFPLTQMLVDVVYLLGEEQLFVLLRMGVVLVVSTATNPCSTLQLWAPTLKNSIHCIATVRAQLCTLL